MVYYYGSLTFLEVNGLPGEKVVYWGPCKFEIIINNAVCILERNTSFFKLGSGGGNNMYLAHIKQHSIQLAFKLMIALSFLTLLPVTICRRREAGGWEGHILNPHLSQAPGSRPWTGPRFPRRSEEAPLPCISEKQPQCQRKWILPCIHLFTHQWTRYHSKILGTLSISAFNDFSCKWIYVDFFFSV